MPVATLGTVQATWNRERSPHEIREFLAPRLASHALADVDITVDDFNVDSLFDGVE